MTSGEALYLILVIAGAAIFSVALAWVSRQSSKSQILLPPAPHNH